MVFWIPVTSPSPRSRLGRAADLAGGVHAAHGQARAEETRAAHVEPVDVTGLLLRVVVVGVVVAGGIVFLIQLHIDSDRRGKVVGKFLRLYYLSQRTFQNCSPLIELLFGLILGFN